MTYQAAKMNLSTDGETVGLSLWPLNNNAVRDATLEPMMEDGELRIYIQRESTTEAEGLRVGIGGGEEFRALDVAVADVAAAAQTGSDDAEIAALRHALDLALELLGAKPAEPDETPTCENCGETMQDDEYGMCGSCVHNARRSGWEPGQ